MAMRRCLRKLISQGGEFINNRLELEVKSSYYGATHVYSNYNCSTSSFNPFSLNRLLQYSSSEYPNRMIGDRVQQVGGSCTRKLTDEDNTDLIGIKVGEFVNLSQLLFTETRDYLIKSDGTQVKAEELAGKVVVVYFDSVSDIDTGFLTYLIDIYSELQRKSGFEIVFVDVDDVVDSFSSEVSLVPSQDGPQKHFEEVFSRMPWTAIPLSDITTRKCLKRKFGVPEKIYIGIPVVVGSTGMILQSHAYAIFCHYGAQGYPFTNERIDFLDSEDDAAARQPSLKTLLASPERDYLISNKGDKVPIHTLEDMVVGLYFYNEYHPFVKEFTLKLKSKYEELTKNNKKMEVVLIYIEDEIPNIEAEEAFWELFKTMPWLALPIGDSNYYKLKQIFFFPWDRDPHMNEMKLIVLGPHMEFIEPFGSEIMSRFGIQAYPFFREKVAMLAAEEAKKLKLEMLWDPNSIFGGNYGSPVSLSQLVGKRVIIFFDEGKLWRQEYKFLEILKDQYIQMRGTEDEFEVIHITALSTKTEHVADLPWFVQPRGRDDNIFRLFGYYVSLIAFDQNGTLVRKAALPTFEDTKFPFYAGNLENEALSQAVGLCGWDRYRDGFPGLPIFSYRKEKV